MATHSPCFRPLNVSDVDSAVRVENAAFMNPAYRCSADKFEYRLTRVPQTSYGLFCPVEVDQVDFTASEVAPPESGSRDVSSMKLVAHACSTLGPGTVVNDADMDYPKNWREPGACEAATVGHQVGSRTVCLHSFAVDPEVQRRGAGKLAMNSYLRAMAASGIADRVALLCQDYLVKYYEQFGFANLGESQAEYGGGGWYNMVFDFTAKEA